MLNMTADSEMPIAVFFWAIATGGPLWELEVGRRRPIYFGSCMLGTIEASITGCNGRGLGFPPPGQEEVAPDTGDLPS